MRDALSNNIRKVLALSLALILSAFIFFAIWRLMAKPGPNGGIEVAAEDGIMVFDANLASEDIIDLCEKNEDCIKVRYDHCCGLKHKSINRKYLRIYNTQPDWQKFDNPGECKAIEACPEADGSPVCQNYGNVKKCILDHK